MRGPLGLNPHPPSDGQVAFASRACATRADFRRAFPARPASLAPMPVTRRQIIARGLANRCPNCGGRTLFVPGKLFELDRTCRACTLPIEREEGFFLGAMALNYGVTCFGLLAPVALLWYLGVLGGRAAVIVAVSLALLAPIALYRASRSWQLMLYYFFLPQHLPANRHETGGLPDEPL
jgi:uncharacterized protein (DUF983 family)